MSIYVPTYLKYNSRDAEGWPSYLDDEGKQFLLKKVDETLQKGQFQMEVFYNVIFNDPELPKCLQGIVVLDAKYAAVHRALIHLANPIWIPKD